MLFHIYYCVTLTPPFHLRDIEQRGGVQAIECLDHRDVIQGSTSRVADEEQQAVGDEIKCLEKTLVKRRLELRECERSLGESQMEARQMTIEVWNSSVM